MRRSVPLLGGLALLVAAAAGAETDHRAATPPAPFAVEAAQAESIRYAVRTADNNQMGVAVTNYGFIGNNYATRSPSMEYPLGTSFEHLVRAGLWVGANAVDDSGAFVGVSCGAISGRAGASAQLGTEYTPAGLEIAIRSALLNNKFYNPRAVSEQDFICTYSDRPAKRTLENSEGHRPLSILVRQENYSWSFSDYQHSLVYKFVIKNMGPPLANVWVGLYGELASGPKAAYSGWPPGGAWFNKKWIVYEDSLRLFREHYCEGLPIPSGCNLDLVPYWVGYKLLGTSPEPVSTKQITLAAWRWQPGDPGRDLDTQRYAIMSAGTIQDLSAPDLLPQSGDAVEMLAVGPFAQINPGDSVSVDFALVGGASEEAIERHGRFVQRAFDRDYKVPVPPPSPAIRLVARDRALDIYWDNFPESVPDSTGPIPLDFEGYRLYLGEDRNHLQRIAQLDLATSPHDTTGFNTGFSTVQHDTLIDGHHYSYRYTVPGLRNGFKYYAAVTSYDLGNVEIESLESGINQNKTLAIPGPAPGERPKGTVYVFPNPYRVEAKWDQGRQVRDHYLWFTNLPERCTLRIYTLSGDLVYETDFNGATYHGEGARGIYDPTRELDVAAPTLSGTTFGWNLITREGQAAATGLYMYSVEDAGSSARTVGKFVIVKSDREGF